jgi:hypothetical protein
VRCERGKVGVVQIESGHRGVERTPTLVASMAHRLGKPLTGGTLIARAAAPKRPA